MEAPPAADETIRLRPHDNFLHRCIISKAIAYYQSGQYDEAELVARDSLREDDTWWVSNLWLTASLAQMGRKDEAEIGVRKIQRSQPRMTLDTILSILPFADLEHCEHLSEGLIKAGWTDAKIG